ERVGQARAVVVALGRHEHLGLVLQPPEGLAVHDPVAVALQGRAQRAVLLRPGTPRGVGARRVFRQPRLLPCHPLLRIGGPDWPCGGIAVHARSLTYAFMRTWIMREASANPARS